MNILWLEPMAGTNKIEGSSSFNYIMQENLVLFTNIDFLIHISLQPNAIDLRYFKQWSLSIRLILSLKYQRLHHQRPNLKILKLIAEPPKTSSNWAAAQISNHWIQFQVEPTMFETRLKFKTQHKIF